MQAQYERWRYTDGARMWYGKYRNSQNLPHWHRDCEAFCVDRGSLDLVCNGQTYSLETGCEAFVDSEQVHYLHARTADTVVSHIIFDYEIIRPFAGGLTLVSPVLSKDYGFPGVYAAVRREFTEKKPFFAESAACAVEKMAIDIFRGERTAPRESAAPADRIKPLLAHIRETYEFFDLDAAAAFMNMNPTYFSTLFHKLTGMTFSQYMNYVKVERALELLTEHRDLSMTEISIRCGFETIRNFNRIFKKYTGYAPRDIPANFILTPRVRSDARARGNDPTLTESELLESSDMPGTTPSH